MQIRPLFTVLLTACFPLSAQGAPRLVLDLTTQAPWPGSSSPSNGASAGGLAYFTAHQAITGREVWCTDGSAAGTRLPAETLPGPDSARYQDYRLWRYGTRIVFSAGGFAGDHETWVGDGTTAGTGPTPRLPFTEILDLVEVGGLAYVSSSARGSSTAGLWRTDFTPAGTTLLATMPTAPHHLTVFGTSVMFFAAAPATGTEPWVTDGTVAGTRLVRDVAPGAAGSILLSPSDNSPLAVVPGVGVFFPAHDGVNGLELWRTDGVTASLVHDIQPGGGWGLPDQLTFGAAVFAGRVVFAATDAGYDVEPWITNGTMTTRLVDLGPGAAGSWPTGFTTLGAVVCFWADDGVVGIEPWVTDGTAAGTRLLRDITPSGMFPQDSERIVVNGRILFAAGEPATGTELWATDGTPQGTVLVADIQPGRGSSNPCPLALVGSSAVLAADDGVRGSEVWISDGTSAGTRLLIDIEPSLPGTALHSAMALGDRLLFATAAELWRSDGTVVGTTRVRAGSSNRFVDRPVASLPAAELFIADDGRSGSELWRTDGTTLGTALVRDINPLGDGVPPWSSVATLGPETVVFAAGDGTNGAQLWRTDGTWNGTVAVTNLAWSGPLHLTPLEPPGGSRMALFIAGEAQTGFEPWRTDGTAAGTVLVKDIWPGPSGSDDDLGLLPMGAYVLFGASDGTRGFELWRSDGTAAGTFLVKDIAAGDSSPNLRGAVRVGDIAYFAADDGMSGYEVWRSDGTAAGTRLVLDIRPGAGSSQPSAFAAFGDELLFIADDGTHGRELWITTQRGTGARLLVDLNTGPKSGLGWGETFALPGAQRALFLGSDGSGSGAQLWRTDGTTVARHWATPTSGGFHLAGTNLYFGAWDPTVGHELFVMRSMAAAVPFGLSCRGSNGWPSLRGTGPVLGRSTMLDLAAGRATTPAVFALDPVRTAVNLGADCTLMLATLPVLVALTTDGTGRASLSLAVPNVPSLSGRQVFAQAAVYDPGFGAFGTVVWTNGLQLVIQ